MEDGDFCGRKESRCFVPSHSLVQGEENFLLVPSCFKDNFSPQILLELGTGARFSSLRGRTYSYNQLGGGQ